MRWELGKQSGSHGEDWKPELPGEGANGVRLAKLGIRTVKQGEAPVELRDCALGKARDLILGCFPPTASRVPDRVTHHPSFPRAVLVLALEVWDPRSSVEKKEVGVAPEHKASSVRQRGGRRQVGYGGYYKNDPTLALHLLNSPCLSSA